MSAQVIVVDDEAAIREAVQQWLELSGFDVRTCASAAEALALVDRDFPGIVVSDVRMPGSDGLQLLDKLLQVDTDLPVILVTGHGDVPMAVQALRQGAYDFIEKPFTPERLLDSVRRALDKRRLVCENRQLRRQVADKGRIESQLIGISRPMENLRRQILELAGTSVNVLIRGETGSGKERVARSLHDFSPRASKAFAALNCAAIPETIFESELFGHESGAFTGAQARRIGRIEHADGGTLFLDEVESLPLAQQVKLLRVLQEKTLERLGSNKSIQVDLRVISAAKPDLLDEVKAGRFREDLVYRLNVATLHIPPLRERREDIPLLFEHFAHEAALRHGREAPPLAPSELARLLGHDWPGNVRELINAAERHALGLSSPPPAERFAGQALAQQMEAFEAQCLHNALLQCQGNITAVMEMLQLPRRTLNEKMQRHGLARGDYLPGGEE
ncbi:sigma-54-dependent transcriptional regulator [Ectopseudomonas chengduensis]|jgi:two-component system C4-dicarboxylate transport response regulator DctD|uniref:Two component, sigma-54 specific, transcriptional regulator, Fis family n=1 Tax=Ectopseudomonas oleovorans TaxID=301 RepID=A0A379JRI3_ECTOL|nr:MULTISPECIES: sigma-54 dependent transcriptional regulator [Pseudomonas]MDH1561964.1 sigma-54 dependent transcriptional regulator [Pseudomonas chengduensis]NMY17942.1 sigma-54-dependent Fis family transcriptional regulator [Pseudomonas sp. WS 5019]OWK48905.1 C4-dicarboxylate transport transcriptional regulatory protein DctD [Pseudomonas oleovorans subsp. oleovorans]SEJ19049.1 two-component system, NtrC family, C4-dicarboxylate transport response regulator DctD [Pseudomonas oleovorans]SUD512